MKVLHTADWHARDIDYDEVEKCLGFLVDMAIGHSPDLIVVAGDLSDSQEIRMQSRSAQLIFKAVTELSRVAPVVIPIGTGTHDGLAPILFKYVDLSRIWVSEVPEQIFLTKNGLTADYPENPMAVISQFPAPTKQHFQSVTNSVELTDMEIAEAMSQVFAGFGALASSFDCPHILTGHWNVRGAHVSSSQILTGRDIEVVKDQIEMARADLVCLGHIHFNQQIGNNIFFSGSIYRKDFGEMEDHGFYIHEVEKGNVESEFLLSPTRKLVKLDADLTKQKEFATESLADVNEDITNAIVRYQIKVYADEARIINQAELKRLLEETRGAQSADIRLSRIPRENVRCERLLQINNLPDKLKEMAAIKNEPISEEVIEKARLLETEEPSAILDALIKDIERLTEPEANQDAKAA